MAATWAAPARCGSRLRSAATLSFPVSKAVKVEAGYLNQHRFVRGAPDTDDHALTLSLGFSF